MHRLSGKYIYIYILKTVCPSLVTLHFKFTGNNPILAGCHRVQLNYVHLSVIQQITLKLVICLSVKPCIVIVLGTLLSMHCEIVTLTTNSRFIDFNKIWTLK